MHQKRPIISPSLLSNHPVISDQVNKQELAVILVELEKVLQADVSGEIAEFGCYKGTTSLFLRRVLDAYKSDKQLHVYDSFEGLPDKVRQDRSVAGDQFKAGELKVGKKELLLEFKKAHLAMPNIHKGWFGELTAADVPDHIAFAYLDGDFYESILDSLKLVWPRLSPGGVVCIDDYNRSALPGVERAVHDYFGRKFCSEHLRVQLTQAVIHKEPGRG